MDWLDIDTWLAIFAVFGIPIIIVVVFVTGVIYLIKQINRPVNRQPIEEEEQEN